MKHLEHTEKKQLLAKALICGFVMSVIVSFFPFAAACGELPENVVRLHVIAHSDSQEDQQVKLKVRDAVLEEAAKWYQGAQTMEEANTLLCTHLESLTEAANRVLREEAMGYSAKVQMTEMYFPTRDYETFRLPAGRYRALRVTLGDAAGKNWWCVAFPSLCLPAAGEEEEQLLSLPEWEREIVGEPEGLEVKFKAVELWEALREWLRG